MKPALSTARPAPRLRAIEAIAIIVGVVVGVGIFRAPNMVAAAAETPLGFVAMWALGGLLSLAGALCYGELVAAFPHAGGEYHFLQRAFGGDLAFLFAWARLTVIGTGSIALLAFVFGDYAATLAPIGPHGSAIYAAALVVVLVGLNVLGVGLGALIQTVLTTLLVVGLVGMSVAALLLGPSAPVPPPTTAPSSTLGLAMVFVLLTYGGWNEAAYLSAEVRGGPRRMALTMIGGVGAVAALYVVASAAYVHVLGIAGVRAAETVGAALMQDVAGPAGAGVVSALVAAAALTSMNATIMTVARTAYALGRDRHVFRWLGRWDGRAGAPVAGLLALGACALALILVGAIARRGFATMVEYTAPVFWSFFLLTGLSVFVLRVKEPDADRPFRVPLYPVTPIVFCATCAWLLYASLAYTRLGAAVGIGVLLLGFVPLWIERRRALWIERRRALEPRREPCCDQG